MTGKRRFAHVLGVGYLVSLALLIIVMRFVGEQNWITTLLLYLPRVGFFLPLPVVVIAYLAVGDRRRAVTSTIAATVLIVFPLMGFRWKGPRPAAPGQIRVMTWNTYYGRVDNDAIRRMVADENPDIFVAQATAHRTRELFRADPGGYALENDEEFFLATKFPVVEKVSFADAPDETRHRANYVRYTLKTPTGLVDLFSMHPKSPRTGVDRFRGTGLRTKLAQGELPDDTGPIEENTELRRRQVEDVAAAVRASKNPVIVAGDTNLPTLSWLYDRTFGQLQDSFTATGRGFGYTFPAKRAWLRIDRVLADDHFRFLESHVGPTIASDHHYVVADLFPEPNR